ncbi:DUF1874 domain-containing protein [Candidatus Methylospira mobilis]|uniref:STIV orfB116 family protein n=1 Tax=Candidatus Methylospira mobilis TaxID=1808979 RepID=UPI0028E39FC2|nr:DUF1874 domain-containing protein [Candidatus Methylospira mobilis]WNV06609.1 DUF1874 domain-containing protein [Candidatus Methylospira mobilis]
MSRLLGFDIAPNRIAVSMAAGDHALILRLLQRLPEGKILDEVELAAVPLRAGIAKPHARLL